MTVSELIEKLQKLPPSMRVVTPGFDESYYDDVKTVEVITLRIDVYPPGHTGTHFSPDEWERDTGRGRNADAKLEECCLINF